MSLKSLVAEYAAALRVANLAKKTIKSYCSRVRAFDRWLADGERRTSNPMPSGTTAPTERTGMALRCGTCRRC